MIAKIVTWLWKFVLESFLAFLLYLVWDGLHYSEAEYLQYAWAKPEFDIQLRSSFHHGISEQAKLNLTLHKGSVSQHITIPLESKVEVKITNVTSQRAFLIGRASGWSLKASDDALQSIENGRDSVLWIDKDFNRITEIESEEFFKGDSQILSDTLPLPRSSLPDTFYVHYLVFYQNEFGPVFYSYLKAKYTLTPLSTTFKVNDKFSDDMTYRALFDSYGPEVIRKKHGLLPKYYKDLLDKRFGIPKSSVYEVVMRNLQPFR